MSEFDQPGAEGTAPTRRGLVAGMHMFGRRFRLERMLGRGGMGVVWLARDLRLEREVALKFLPEEVAHDRAALDELREETRRSLQLTHPHIVRVYDFHEEGGSAAIAMEYVDGDTLSTLRLERPGRVFTTAALLPWMRQACEALEYAHRMARMVHRDIKPANLMVNAAGEVRITDFGIARSLAESMTRVSGKGRVDGTLAYMSPQQFAGEPPSPADDIYSLGATIYELLAGKPPFYEGEISQQVLREIPPSIAARRKELGVTAEPVPRHWEATVAACLAKDPAERPTAAKKVMCGLEAGGEPEVRIRVPELPAGAGGSRPEEGKPRNGIKRYPYPNEKPEQATQKMDGCRKFFSDNEIVVWTAAAIAALGLCLFVGWQVARLRAERHQIERKLTEDAKQHEEPGHNAADAQEAWGALVVSTRPFSAMVSVDNGDAQGAPAAFKDLKPGKHKIVVSAEGYAPKEVEAEVSEHAVTKVGPVELEPALGTVLVESEPGGAEVVRSDGRRAGVTPLRLDAIPPGEVSIRLELEGYEPKEARCTAVAGRETNLSAILTWVGPKPVNATQKSPFENSLGMKFVPVPGTDVLFCVWETRKKDYETYASAKPGVDGSWRDAKWSGDVSVSDRPSHPVVSVTWEESKGFCAWLTDKERRVGRIGPGDGYRLPTDHEWSCAAGIGDREDPQETPEVKDWKIEGVYPWGTTWPPAKYSGNFCDLTCWQSFDNMGDDRIRGYNDGYATTAPVENTSFGNEFGIYDLGGNVREWCEDRYASGDDCRVVRGSSWLDGNHEIGMRSSHRDEQRPDKRLQFVGFRCVLAVSGHRSEKTSGTVVNGKEAAPSPALVRTAPAPALATRERPFENFLGMRFVPAPITGGPTAGQDILFCIWETRRGDYEAYARENPGVDGSWRDSRHEGVPVSYGPEYPVVCVSWEDAKGFCAWLTQKERAENLIKSTDEYRLPSDHEWSCAIGIGDHEDPLAMPLLKSAVIGGTDIYPWGTGWPPPKAVGNYSDEAAERRFHGRWNVISGYEDGYATTAPVGCYSPNKLGLYDLGGNVWEWCEDDLLSSTSGKLRVTRGASWDEASEYPMRLTTRLGIDGADPRSVEHGFRCVLAVSPQMESTGGSDAPFAVQLGSASQYVYGTSVAGITGFVLSPYKPTGGLVDVRDPNTGSPLPRGTKVMCPCTDKVFLCP